VAEREADGDEADELGAAQCGGGRDHEDEVDALR
jgi:hypothetical protein